MTPPIRVNVGCGQTPTLDWLNFDNSPTVYLARLPVPLLDFARRFGVIPNVQWEFATIVKKHGIRWANGAKRMPLSGDSVDVVYTSHMLEHLDKYEAERFLREALRILKPGGVLRVVVPDLKCLVERYNRDGNADVFLKSTLLVDENCRSFLARVRFLCLGSRNHKWLYDGASLTNRLEAIGFVDLKIMRAGETMIDSPGLLDLSERADESVYVEACKKKTIAPAHAI